MCHRWKQANFMAIALAVPAGVVGGCASPIDPAANAAFLAGLGQMSITVLPAFVREGDEAVYDPEAANAIGACFTDNGLADVSVSDDQVPITGSWGVDQARMFGESAADFAAYIEANPIETEYALLAEYLRGGRGDFVGVHCYIVDAQGRLAWGRLWNSHHEAFAAATLDTPDDCTAMLTQELATLLAPADSEP